MKALSVLIGLMVLGCALVGCSGNTAPPVSALGPVTVYQGFTCTPTVYVQVNNGVTVIMAFDGCN